MKTTSIISKAEKEAKAKKQVKYAWMAVVVIGIIISMAVFTWGSIN